MLAPKIKLFSNGKRQVREVTSWQQSEQATVRCGTAPPLIAILRKGKTMMTFIHGAAVALLLAPTIASSQDYNAGGRAYEAGDYATALREWKPLAETGMARAQYNLGVIYDNGLGVEQDYEEAVRWYRLAAEQGYASAQYNLGVFFDSGLGVVQDYEEAVRWYRLAAEQGDAGAQYGLGVMHANGLGVEQDYVEAVRLYRLAAEQGEASAQYGLGFMYVNGNGVVKDYVTAHMWANIAAAKGHENAPKARDSLEPKMTANTIAEAQRRARVCMASNYRDCN